jgi:exopolyphosphatase/guanosine-5'-triphosphate,3'-diphosphate pyrophosphatase
LPRLATIDLGTNTVRLLVVETGRGRWHPLYQAQRITRLGEGQAPSGRLQPAPMERTAAAVAEYVAAARAHGTDAVRIVATAAVRDAANREEFLALLEGATGRRVEVVSGEDEARLTLLGVAAGLPAVGPLFLLFDIGGGSTEFVLADGGKPRATVSLRLGVVPLAEEFVGPGRVAPARWARLYAEVERRLLAGIPPEILEPRPPALVGTAGTVTTLAALDLGLQRYDPGRVQGHVLTRRAVEAQRARLAAMTAAERGALPCMEPGRADVIIPGIAICLGAMAILGYDSLVVSDHGLREGILCEILAGSR